VWARSRRRFSGPNFSFVIGKPVAWVAETDQSGVRLPPAAQFAEFFGCSELLCGWLGVALSWSHPHLFALQQSGDV
ncbi:hypothetical protein, partial [Candidatus Frankia alpina]|uniref:hypothetical protein n=1 Tax=Candidatus Frankia alpina TaxID=2699483 RepID=UPI001A98A6C3